MEGYTISTSEAEAIRNAMAICKKRLIRAGKDKTASGSDMDGWHDEMFKVNMESEAQADTMLKQLRDVLVNAVIVEPEEQSELVQLGNAVDLEFEDGESAETYVLVGYQVGGKNPSSISLKSPLGKVLLGARAGETKSYSVRDGFLSVKIIGIHSPSYVKEVILQNA